MEKAGGALPGLQEFCCIGDTSEHRCLHSPLPPWVGGIYPGALTYLQGHCSMFLDTLPEPILAQTNGTSRIHRALLTFTWTPYLSHSG